MEIKPVRVAVCGALGKMGLEVVKTVLADTELELVGVIDPGHAGKSMKEATQGSIPSALILQADLLATLQQSQADVCVDFTHPGVVYDNTIAIIEAGCRPIIGTTGLSPEQKQSIALALEQKKLGGLIAPNFAIGAILLMKFAQEAAKYLDHAEIIEFHHNQKADAPSGTAIKTAELMAESRAAFNPSNAPEKEIFPGARGSQSSPGGIPIHSVRLPGYIAHQEVIFGAQGQTLSIRHDSLDRSSFMPGVAMACKKMMKKSGLIYGLEHLI